METISVTQDTGLGLLVSPTTFDLTNAAQDIEIEVQKNVQYSITIDEACKSWISQKGTKALSSEKVTFSVAANDSYDDREGKITFKQTDGDLVQTVTVRQSQTYGLFITTPEYDLSNEAHTLTVEVKANVEYEVSSEVEWIKYKSTSTKALTASQLTFEVDANETYDDREGHVVLKQKGGDLSGTIIIRQDENYGIFVSKESASISKEAQNVEVEVKHNVDLNVIVPDEAMGTMITSIEYDDKGAGTKALSTRTYRFGVTKNDTYEPREVSITFKQKDGALSGTFVISQDKETFLNVAYTEKKVSFLEQEYEVSVESNTEYNCSSETEWISCEKKADNSGIVYRVAKNETTQQRTGSIKVILTDGSITKTITIYQYPKEKGVYYNLSYGGLDNELNNYQRDTISRMVVKGVLNKADFETINNLPSLYYLDIAGCDVEDDYLPVNAFKDNSTIKAIILPESLTAIGTNAFYGALRLVDINIPDTVTSIGESAFNNCIALKNISISDKSGLISIADHAFEKNYALEAMNLPSGLECIGFRAFYLCSKLHDISLPQSLKTLRLEAFNGCSSIESIVIPENIHTISNYTFYQCTSLQKVQLPVGFEMIGYGAFKECSSLSSINIPETTRFDGMCFSGCVSLATIIIPEGTATIPWYCFEYCPLTEVTLPTSIKSINRGFRGCSQLNKIISLASIPPEIDEFAFTNYTNVTVFVRPEDLEGYQNSKWGSLFAGKIKAIEN